MTTKLHDFVPGTSQQSHWLFLPECFRTCAFQHPRVGFPGLPASRRCCEHAEEACRIPCIFPLPFSQLLDHNCVTRLSFRDRDLGPDVGLEKGKKRRETGDMSAAPAMRKGPNTAVGCIVGTGGVGSWHVLPSPACGVGEVLGMLHVCVEFLGCFMLSFDASACVGVQVVPWNRIMVMGRTGITGTSHHVMELALDKDLAFIGHELWQMPYEVQFTSNRIRGL